MFFELTAEEKALVNTEVEVKESKKKGIKNFNTELEEEIVNKYLEGLPTDEIKKLFNVSVGTIYAVLNNYNVPKRKGSTVAKKLEHILNDQSKVAEIIEDYKFMTLKAIYVKHNIHKNGLYYILDIYGVPRKTSDLEDILSEQVEKSA